METPCNSDSYFHIKTEEEETEFNLLDLHHSIDIKEETVILDSQLDSECKLETTGEVWDYKNAPQGSLKILKNDKPFTCEMCGYCCKQKGTLEIHIRTHTGEKPFSCDFCGFRCARKDGLKSHLTIHTGEKTFACGICDYKCALKEILKVHLRTHSGEKPFKCETCGFQCAQDGNFKNHLKTHTGEKPFMCDICDYKCAFKAYLIRHLITHTGDKPFTCELCDYKCARREMLRRHLITHTGEKPFTCEICGCKFTQSTHFKIHLKIHSGEKPYVCEICGYKCVQKTNLNIHLRTHTGEKPYSCEFCKYKCASKGVLNTHLRTHTGEKPYACEFCDFKCGYKASLQIHVKTHTGERPYSCEICGYKCIQKAVLNIHLRTHTGEKPFSCKLCDYKCSRKGNLGIHVKTHTGEKPFVCKICGHKCLQKGNLKIHLKTHTGAKYPPPYGARCSKLHSQVINKLFLIIEELVFPNYKFIAYKMETPNHSENAFQIKTEVKEETEFDLGDLHHSVDIKEETDIEPPSNGELESEDLGIALEILNNDKPFFCNICDYQCARKDQLKRHVTIHTDDKPFACGFCAYKCTRNELLKRHLKTHAQEKPFTCETCGRKFVETSHYRVHLRIHTAEKRFKCEFCDYKCIQSTNLKAHLRIHTGEKPYSCKLCTYKCTAKLYLTKHLRIHTDEKPYSSEFYEDKCAVITNYITNVVHQFSDEEFKKNFRMSRSVTYKLIDEYKNSNFYPKLPHAMTRAVSAENHILSFLWFAGNKCCLRDVAQKFGIGSTTLFRQITRVINFLVDLAPTKIKFPETTLEKEQASREFSRISDFPNVLGCIDGTSITIRTPAHKTKSTYTNRYDIPGITLQGICDHNRKFIDVFTGVPSKIHDAKVLKLSDINDKLPAVCGNKYHLLGDGAYSIREWLLTPFKDAGNLTESQTKFNYKLSATRVLIENSFGILKGRFQQLMQVHLHKVTKIADFIIACCVLHNFCIENNDHHEEETTEPLDNASNEDIVESNAGEVALRKLGERKRNVVKDAFNCLD